MTNNDLYTATYRAIQVPELYADPDFRETREWLSGRVGDIWDVIHDPDAEWVGAADETGETRFVARPGEWIVVAPTGRINVRNDQYVRDYLSAIRHEY